MNTHNFFKLGLPSETYTTRRARAEISDDEGTILAVDGIIWQDPTPLKRRKKGRKRASGGGRKALATNWKATLTPLLERPNEWAMVKSDSKNSNAASSLVSNLNRRIPKMPRKSHTWEFCNRGTKIYAKYIGLAPARTIEVT